MNKRIMKHLTIAATMLLLVSCWIPEEFEATVIVNEDGSYTFAYEGTLADARVLQALKRGALSERDKEHLEARVDNILRDSAMKSVKYIGNGRYSILAEKDGAPGEAYHFPSRNQRIISILPQPNGTIKIESNALDEHMIKEATAVGADVDGVLTVSLNGDVKIIEHNAHSEPWLFGMLGDFEWAIKEIKARPFIIVDPALMKPKTESESHALQKPLTIYERMLKERGIKPNQTFEESRQMINRGTK